MVMMVVMMMMMVVVVVVCAEDLQVMKVNLGQNVTLNCSQEVSYPHWSMEISSELNCCIGQVMTDLDVAFSCYSFRVQVLYEQKLSDHLQGHRWRLQTILLLQEEERPLRSHRQLPPGLRSEPLLFSSNIQIQVFWVLLRKFL